jgi:hypothetical protein
MAFFDVCAWILSREYYIVFVSPFSPSKAKDVLVLMTQETNLKSTTGACSLDWQAVLEFSRSVSLLLKCAECDKKFSDTRWN